LIARFDVYTNRSGSGYLLDVQADLIFVYQSRTLMKHKEASVASCARLQVS